MTPQKNPNHDDTKILWIIAAVVVAGAAGIAMLAGLNADREKPIERTARSVASRPATIETASLERSPTPPMIQEPDVAPDVDVSEPEAVEVECALEPGRTPRAQGLTAYAERDFEQAAACFAETDATHAHSRYMLGLSLWKAGRADDAAVAMQQSAELNPRSIKTYVNLARIENDRGEFASAFAAAERALEIGPEDPVALFLQGRSLNNLQRVPEAITALERSIELAPDNGYVMNLLGLIRIAQGDDAGAVPLLAQAVELEPNVAFIHNNHGTALEGSGRTAEALVAFRPAMELNPSHANAPINVARLEPLVGTTEPVAVIAQDDETEKATATEVASVDTPSSE